MQGICTLKWSWEVLLVFMAVPVPIKQPSAGMEHPGASSLASSHACNVPMAQVLDFAQVDSWRAQRTGFPEVVLGVGKSAEQIAAIMSQLAQNEQIVMATRVTPQVTAWRLMGVLLQHMCRIPQLGSRQIMHRL